MVNNLMVIEEYEQNFYYGHDYIYEEGFCIFKYDSKHLSAFHWLS